MGTSSLHRTIRYEPKASTTDLIAVGVGATLCFVIAWLFTRGGPINAAAGPYFVACCVSSLLYVLVTNRRGMIVTVTADRIHAEALISGVGRQRYVTCFDLRWADVRAITEVTERAESPDGDAPPRNRLRIDEHALHDADFGCVGRTGAYAEVVNAVRDAVGDRLVTRELRGRAP